MATVIYEINTAVWLAEQAWFDPSAPDLGAVPEEQVREWAALGIDVVWFLGVWRKGAATRRISLDNHELRQHFDRVLPGCGPEAIAGSPFSVWDYSLDPAFGGPDALRRLRAKLHEAGLRLMLDFVPNHVAVDHPWVTEHPERFVEGNTFEIEREPGNYFRVPGAPERVLAHGRDPYFAGWTDTAQVNYHNRSARQAMIEQLLRVAAECDAVRCDMAMLVTNGVFRRTWGDLSVLDYPAGGPPEFWEEAIGAVRARNPEFLFMAEVYWDLERELQRLGFDLTYDKWIYDHARQGNALALRDRLTKTADCREKMVLFLENHDESRAAAAFGPRERAAAALMATLPGAHLLHEGQFEGRRVHVPVQMCRRPAEEPDADLEAFYRVLLELMREPAMRQGAWMQPAVWAAWEGNTSDRAIAASLRELGLQRWLTVANLGTHRAQAYCAAPFESVAAPVVALRCRFCEARYHRAREVLLQKGLYLDLAPGEFHVLEVGAAEAGVAPDDYAD